MKIFYIVFIFISFSQFVDAQLGVNLAPLNLNNFWIYEMDDGYRYKYEVIDTNFYIDTIRYDRISMSGSSHTYIMRLNEGGVYVLRRDTTYPAMNHEQLYYKREAVLGDYWVTPHPWTNMFNIHYQVVDTQTNMVFNQPSLLKFVFITDSSGLWEIGQVWTEEFGLLEEIDFIWGPLATLVGCYIDRIVYGDTSLTVGIEDDYFITRNFKLYQNYPNPFNPETRINYVIKETGFVKLTVYNVLGQTVKELVNEIQSAGSHSVNFNAADLPSGVYIYKLKSGEYLSSKKMLLVK